MSWENICAQLSKCSLPTMKHGAEIETGIRLRTATPLEPSQVDGLATILGRAYYEEPHIRYILRDEQTRRRLLPDLFRLAIQATQLNGEIHTTDSLDGGALWIGPGSGLAIGRSMRSGFSSSLQLGWATLRRCITLGLHLDEIHQRLIKGPHWYLLALGVKPSVDRESVRATLVEPLLARADSRGLPCYVETFNEKDLPFYKRR